jgi:signal transduction histidine kinase
MTESPTETPMERTAMPDTSRLLAYVADLELEVDRLRQQGTFIEREATSSLLKISRICTDPSSGDPLPRLAGIESAVRNLIATLKDLHDSPGYHPAHDQVVAVALRPLAEQVFRWQQRLTGARDVTFRLELDVDYVEWFPARLRHILDNLFANALRYRDPSAAEQWLSLGLRQIDGGYELRICDNGAGPPPGEDRRVLDLFYRAAPIRAARLGAGLSVVRLLVEQSGGTLKAIPRNGRGSEFILTLPRYDLLDYIA